MRLLIASLGKACLAAVAGMNKKLKPRASILLLKHQLKACYKQDSLAS